MLAADYGAMYGFMSVFMAFYVILVIALVVLQYVAMWKIFTKSGQPGWKSIVPILSGHTLYKLFWKPVYFYLTQITALMLVVPTTVLQVQLIDGNPSPVLSVLVLVLSLAVSVLDIIWSVKLYLGMARSFGMRDGFAAGLLFLPMIFLMILAFGRQEYLGNTYTKQAPPPTEENYNY